MKTGATQSFGKTLHTTLLTHPDHTEVQFGLLGTLQYQLEACLALIGHPIVIVTFQDPLLFSCKHGPQVHLRHNQDDGEKTLSLLKTLVKYKHTVCHFERTVCRPRLCDHASILLLEGNEAAMQITATPPFVEISAVWLGQSSSCLSAPGIPLFGVAERSQSREHLLYVTQVSKC